MTVKFERVNTGVIGLDEKIEGGFVKGSVNYLTGKTGTGKTTFCCSFLYAGAIKGENGLYITTEQREEEIKNDIVSMFDWDISALEKKGTLKFLSLIPEVPLMVPTDEDVAKFVRLFMLDLSSKVVDAVKKYKAKRVVIDSVSLIETFIKDDYLKKIALMQFINKMKDLKITTLLTGVIPEASEQLSSSGLLEFLTDSVMRLDFVPIAEEFKRTFNVRKMRRTDHSVLIHPFEITKDGIKIIEIKEE